MKHTLVKGWIAPVLLTLVMTGCGSRVKLTPEQETLVGEYAAMALLRHDAGSRSRLLPYEEVEEEEQEEEQETAQEEQQEQEKRDKQEETSVETEAGESAFADQDQPSDTSPAESIGAFFHLPEGVDIVYIGERVCDSYPESGEEDAYFALDAVEGKRLLVLKFDILNQSQAEQKIDLLSQNAEIRITVNESYSRNTLTTMLLDDLSTYTGLLQPGESVGTVLLAEIEPEISDEISSIEIRFQNNGETYSAKLQ